MLGNSKLLILLLTFFRFIKNSMSMNYKIDVLKKGFIVLPDFISDRNCDELVEEINRLPSSTVKSYDNDKRVFGSQHLSSVINDLFAKHKEIMDIGEIMVGRELRFQTTLAGHIVHKEGSLGSGGGWHVDSHSVQFKAMVYLTDVNADNGAFEIIPGSHRPRWFLGFMLNNWRAISSVTRFDSNVISKYPRKKIVAKKGSLVLFNPLLVHRGHPVLNGERYALTNYYIDKRIKVGTAIDNLDIKYSKL